jgi:hypothetical protein
MQLPFSIQDSPYFGQWFGAQVNIMWGGKVMCFIATSNSSSNDGYSKCKKQGFFHKTEWHLLVLCRLEAAQITNVACGKKFFKINLGEY